MDGIQTILGVYICITILRRPAQKSESLVKTVCILFEKCICNSMEFAGKTANETK
jgi:hypothetical protein